MGSDQNDEVRVNHDPEMPPRPPRHVLLLAICFEGGIGLLACLVGWLIGRPAWESIGLTGSALLAGALATLPMLAGLICVRRLPLGPLKRLNATVDWLVVELFAEASLWQLALISLLAGWGEELLFRGLIQSWVADQAGPLAGLLVASLLFGLAHLVTRTYAVIAGLIGLYLGWLALALDNLLVPIVAHGLYDFIAIVYLLHAEKKKTARLVSESDRPRGLTRPSS